MNDRIKFAVFGGDMRIAKLAELLYARGSDVSAFALDRAGLDPGIELCQTPQEAADGAAYAILPLPALGAGATLNAPLAASPCPVSTVLDALTPAQRIFAGKADDSLLLLAQERGLEINDYYAREELAVLNAEAAAEGAIALAVSETQITLCSANCLILGYGRIGRILAQRLHALGAKVTVSSRTVGDMAWCRVFGYGVSDTRKLAGTLGGYDLIINTVPARVLDEKLLRELKPGCLCMDLASKPGGMDFEAASKLGVKAIWALSLPGETAPASSGAIIADTVLNIINESEAAE